MRKIHFPLLVVLGTAGVTAVVTSPKKRSDARCSESQQVVSVPLISYGQPADERLKPATSSDVMHSQPTNAPATATEPFHWRQVESTNYFEYIANLRRIGCPEITIRDIITADVTELYRGRSREEASVAESQIRTLLGSDVAVQEVAVPLVSTPVPEAAGEFQLPEMTNTNAPSPNVPQQAASDQAGRTEQNHSSSIPNQVDHDRLVTGPAAERNGANPPNVGPAADETLSEGQDVLPDPDLLIEAQDDAGDSGLSGETLIESDPFTETVTTAVAIPTAKLKALAERHSLASQIATAAWFLLRLAPPENQTDPAAAELNRLARELVGNAAANELAALK